LCPRTIKSRTSLLTSLTFSSLLLSHTLAASFLAPKHPKTPAQLEKQNLRDEDYKTLPWDDLAENEFFPRHSFLSSNPQEAIPQNPNPAPTPTYPTKTLPNRRLFSATSLPLYAHQAYNALTAAAVKSATIAPSEKVFQAAVPSAQHVTLSRFPAAKHPVSDLVAT
jgi:hypothetical protein